MNGSLRLLFSGCVAFALAFLGGGRIWIVAFGCTVGGLFAGLAVAGSLARRRDRNRFTPGEFTVTLKDAGANKLRTIQALHAVATCGLRKAKQLVDHAPGVLQSNISREDATAIARRLDGVATVEIS